MQFSKSYSIFAGLAFAAAVSGLSLSVIAEDEKPVDKKKPADIHDVMEWSHKGKDSIVSRVRDGKGTAEEIDLLVIYYDFMAKAKPPEGDMESWKAKTGALVKAIGKVQKKEANAVAEYKEAVNCKACHSVHKPKDE